MIVVVNHRSLVLQATLDVEVTNILNLIEDLKQLRDRWDAILAESKLVAEGCSIDQSLKMTNTKRRRERLLSDKTAVRCRSLEDDFSDGDPCDHFKGCVYYPVLDSVVVNLSTRYEKQLGT